MLTILFSILAIACTVSPQVDELWKKDFSTAGELVATYRSIKEQLGDGETALHTRNQCHFVWHCGEYMFKCRGKNPDIYTLPEYAETLSLDDATVAGIMAEYGEERFADHYFTLQAMKNGDDFDAARDGLTITVFYPIRGINHNDYHKLREVFSCSNNALHSAYLEKLKFPIGNSGCSDELAAIVPLIEKNVAESRLKKEVLALIDQYANIMPGKPAPAPLLKDVAGNERSFAEFKGKILVIDVWATWCSSCIKKMPEFLELKESYSHNPNIEFITVSVDRSSAKEGWKAIIAKRGMENMTNLIPDCEEESLFESLYHVSGVPRYMVIDQAGNIVTAYAPPPGGGMEEIIKELITNINNL